MHIRHLLAVLIALPFAAIGAAIECTSLNQRCATKASGCDQEVASACRYDSVTETTPTDHRKRDAMSPTVSVPSNVAANILTMHGTVGFCGVPGQGCPKAEARRTPLPIHEDKGDHRTTYEGHGTVGFCGVPGQGCAKVKMGQGSSTDGSLLAVITEGLDPLDDGDAAARATTSVHGAAENYRPPAIISPEQAPTATVTSMLAIPWAPSTLRTFGQRLSSV